MKPLLAKSLSLFFLLILRKQRPQFLVRLDLENANDVWFSIIRTTTWNTFSMWVVINRVLHRTSSLKVKPVLAGLFPFPNCDFEFIIKSMIPFSNEASSSHFKLFFFYKFRAVAELKIRWRKTKKAKARKKKTTGFPMKRTSNWSRSQSGIVSFIHSFVRSFVHCLLGALIHSLLQSTTSKRDGDKTAGDNEAIRGPTASGWWIKNRFPASHRLLSLFFL